MKISRVVIVLLLALVGLAVSAYLLTVHLGWWSAVCLGVGDCELVNTSRFSEFLGLPVALLGMLAYAGIILLGIAVHYRVASARAPGLLFTAAAVGVGFSIYLTYIELFVLHEICPWCVLSALIVTTIAGLSLVELRTAEND